MNPKHRKVCTMHGSCKHIPKFDMAIWTYTIEKANACT